MPKWGYYSTNSLGTYTVPNHAKKHYTHIQHQYASDMPITCLLCVHGCMEEIAQ